MRSLHVTTVARIAAPPDVVRRQFGDVSHHADAGVHRGVRFEVIDDDGVTCRYQQTTRVGPLRLRQELRLERIPDAPLVNTITGGQFAGGSITFDITEVGATSADVTATLRADLTGPVRLAAPILRRSVRRALNRALDEDKDDLESGRYLAVTLETSA